MLRGKHEYEQRRDKKVKEENLEKVSGGRATEIQERDSHTRPDAGDFWVKSNETLETVSGKGVRVGPTT